MYVSEISIESTQQHCFVVPVLISFYLTSLLYILLSIDLSLTALEPRYSSFLTLSITTIVWLCLFNLCMKQVKRLGVCFRESLLVIILIVILILITC